MSLDHNPTVLICSEYGVRNGGENSCLSLLPGLRKQGFNFQFAVPTPSEFAAELEQQGFEVAHFWTSFNGQRRNAQEIEDHLASICNDPRINVVHGNSLAISRILGRIKSRIRCSVIGHLRDIIKISRKAIDDLNQLDRLIAVSQAVADWYLELGVDPQRIQVIHNGIDGQKFQPAAATGYLHRELNLPAETQLVLSVGQIGMRKGLDLTARALARLKLDSPHLNFAWLITGERNSIKDEAVELESNLHKFAETQDFATHLLGRRTDVNSMMNESSVLVHLARQEPFGRVLLEAAAAGCPIVTTHVGGTEEMLHSCPTAKLLDVQELELVISSAASAIGDWLESTQSSTLATETRSIILNRFGLDHAVKSLSRVYSELLDFQSDS